MEERRRLERDLHDGAQQQLVSIGLDLRHVQSQLGPGSSVQDQLDDSVRRLGGAIRDLRELAHGIRAAALDAGLGPALSELAGRKALANALKHATPARIEVLADRVQGRLVVAVSDDGPGGAVIVPGSGLAGVGDRVAALGGKLTLDIPARGGTTVRVELPCG